jgi:diamine N-acetyltransferase
MADKTNTIILKEITGETCWPIFNLEVDDSQTRMVAPNAHSIAEAYFSDLAWFRGIYLDDEPVGFVMLSIDKETPEYFLWRLMIDKNHQRQGYGYRAMEKVIDYVRGLPNAKELKTSYVPIEGGPAPFYYKLGFEETGELFKGENLLVLALD